MKLQFVNDSEFNRLERFYVVEKGGKQEAHQFMTYVYNALSRYVESGDYTHLNNIVTAARAASRYRQVMRVIPSVAAHKFDNKAKEYGGRADGKKLAEAREESEQGNVYKWQDWFYSALMDEGNHDNQTPEWSWDKKRKNLVRIVKEAREHGIDDAEIRRAVAEAEEAAQPEREDTPMPEVTTNPNQRRAATAA